MEDLYQIGDKIVFKYTGFEAEIIEIFQDETYRVWMIKDQEEGLAFHEDIIPISQFVRVEESDIQKQLKKKNPSFTTEEIYFGKASLTKKNRATRLQSKTPDDQKIVNILPEFKLTPPTESGCHLAFIETSTGRFTIYLINDLSLSFGFEFKLFLNKKLEHGFNKTIAANQFYAIGEFALEQFNDHPSVSFRSRSLQQEINLKIKYNKFIKSRKKIPLMGAEGYCLALFKYQNPYLDKQKDIKEYTKNHQSVDKSSPSYHYTKYNLNDLANFNTEIDLHAEKIVVDTSEYSPAEIYQLQLKSLANYIDKAVQLGIDCVFVIHGLGKGKLQHGVAKYLKYHDNVLDFKNEFHEKYGFGATKVTLKD